MPDVIDHMIAFVLSPDMLKHRARTRRIPLLSPTMSKHDLKKKKHPHLDNVGKTLTKLNTDLENHKRR